MKRYIEKKKSTLMDLFNSKEQLTKLVIQTIISYIFIVIVSWQVSAESVMIDPILYHQEEMVLPFKKVLTIG